MQNNADFGRDSINMGIDKFIGGQVGGKRTPFQKGDKVIVPRADELGASSVKGIVFTIWDVPVLVPNGDGTSTWVCSVVNELEPMMNRETFGVVADVLEKYVPAPVQRFDLGPTVEVTAHGTAKRRVIGIIEEYACMHTFVVVGWRCKVKSVKDFYGENYYELDSPGGRCSVFIAERDLQGCKLCPYVTDTFASTRIRHGIKTTRRSRALNGSSTDLLVGSALKVGVCSRSLRTVTRSSWSPVPRFHTGITQAPTSFTIASMSWRMP